MKSTPVANNGVPDDGGFYCCSLLLPRIFAPNLVVAVFVFQDYWREKCRQDCVAR